MGRDSTRKNWVRSCKTALAMAIMWRVIVHKSSYSCSYSCMSRQLALSRSRTWHGKLALTFLQNILGISRFLKTWEVTPRTCWRCWIVIRSRIRGCETRTAGSLSTSRRWRVDWVHRTNSFWYTRSWCTAGTFSVQDDITRLEGTYSSICCREHLPEYYHSTRSNRVVCVTE
jgi:hypothetical protein